MDKGNETFIGKEFKTPTGDTLTVICVAPRERNELGVLKGKKYKVICSKCNEDDELYGSYFTTKKHNLLVAGNIPCVCSGVYRYSKEQYEVKVKRECEKRNYTFIGFDQWKGHKTKLKLNCEKHGEWSSTTMEGFLSGTGCPSCAHEFVSSVRRYSAEDYITNFKDKYIEGTIFTPLEKVKGVYKNWEVICPVCSTDKYVLSGVCSGVFKYTSGGLSNGKVSCRCSKHYSYSKEQREYQIKSLMEDRTGIFDGWVDGYVNANSKVKWLCKEGHPCEHPVGSLVRGAANCNECAMNEFGFYKNRQEDPDQLYLIKFTSDTENFIKVGRTFNIQHRLNYFKKFYDIEVLSILKGKHKTVYKTEQDYHTFLKGKGLHYLPDKYFAGSYRECFIEGSEEFCYF